MQLTENEKTGKTIEIKSTKKHKIKAGEIDWEAAAKLYNGLTLTEFSEKVGCGRSTVFHAYRKGKVEVKLFKPNDWKRIGQYSKKYTVRELSELEGIPIGTIYSAIHRGDIACRSGRSRSDNGQFAPLLER